MNSLANALLTIATGAAAWLAITLITPPIMRYLWDDRPYTELFVVHICVMAALVVAVSSAAISWSRAGPWWQHWLLYLCGLTACIFMKSYWGAGGQKLALGIISGPAFITCLIASLVAFVIVSILRDRTRPGSALARALER